MAHCQGFNVTDLNNWQFLIRRIEYEFWRTSDFHAIELEKQSYFHNIDNTGHIYIIYTYLMFMDEEAFKQNSTVINVDSW